jgi:hypothetical protein
MEGIAMIERLKVAFERVDSELCYDAGEFRFRWSPKDPELPNERGVYCLLSHKGSRVQKVGKADGAYGLRGRFLGYTGKKTTEKILRDKTDQRWKAAMTGELRAQPLSVYYFITKPQPIASPIDFGDGVQKELQCHWARSFEQYLSALFRKDYKDKKVLNVTHFLLAGLGN